MELSREASTPLPLTERVRELVTHIKAEDLKALFQ